jgi:hypothetical protein
MYLQCSDHLYDGKNFSVMNNVADRGIPYQGLLPTLASELSFYETYWVRPHFLLAVSQMFSHLLSTSLYCAWALPKEFIARNGRQKIIAPHFFSRS